MIVVTGGAGFIGSNLVRALNDRGRTDIVVVDNLTNADKVKNLSDLRIEDYFDKQEFNSRMPDDSFLADAACVLHEGACSDTMATDGAYVMSNNFTFSKNLYEFCRRRGAQYIYASSASVYGAGDLFEELPEYEHTLNAYAYSKLLFDNYVRAKGRTGNQVVGLRYFNVYGPREQHKGRMASVAWHFFHQLRSSGCVKLFRGTEGYADGEQLRDFISVDDVVAVNMYLMDHPGVQGIFNLGTGRCRSFNDVALAVVNSSRKIDGEQSLSLQEARDSEIIRYIDMPEALIGKYQNYTQANMDRLRAAGYESVMLDVEDGVGRYIDYLNERY
ncbi:MAG: ADP-glyceromanno-heptose 6-epimerase [Pseudomonadota bacterium]